jgi:hypothetical protein
MYQPPHDVRTELADSTSTRVEMDAEGVLHVHCCSVSLRLNRDLCEELATTLARAVVALARRQPKARKAKLRLLQNL